MVVFQSGKERDGKQSMNSGNIWKQTPQIDNGLGMRWEETETARNNNFQVSGFSSWMDRDVLLLRWGRSNKSDFGQMIEDLSFIQVFVDILYQMKDVNFFFWLLQFFFKSYVFEFYELFSVSIEMVTGFSLLLMEQITYNDFLNVETTLHFLHFQFGCDV